MRTVLVRIARGLWDGIARHFAKGKKECVEQFAFVLAVPVSSRVQGDVYLAKGVVLADKEDMEAQSAGIVRPSRKLQGLAYQLAQDEKLSVIDFHTHTHGGRPNFSSIDDYHGQLNARYVSDHLPPECRMGMVVFNEDMNAFQGRLYDRGAGTSCAISGIEILGSPTSILLETDAFDPSEQLIFSRHSLIPGWDQSALANIRVAVAGLGGTGSLMLQGLIGMGIGRNAGVALCDADVVEASNLPRLPYATKRDIGRRKVKVAAQFFRKRDRKTRLHPYALGVQAFWSREALKTAHLLIGCVDSEGARQTLSELSLRYLIPYVDVATEIVLNKDGKYDSIGQVRVVIPGQTGCLFCCGGINTQEAAQDLLSGKARRQQQRRGYVRNTNLTPTPAIIYLNGILTHLALSHVAKLVNGEGLDGREHLYYDRNRDSIMAVGCRPNPECPACGPGGILGAGDPVPHRPPESPQTYLPVLADETEAGHSREIMRTSDRQQACDAQSDPEPATEMFERLETTRRWPWSWLYRRKGCHSMSK